MEKEHRGGSVSRAKLVKRHERVREVSLLVPSKIRGTMPRVIYPVLKEARHSGYKRDNKEY